MYNLSCGVNCYLLLVGMKAFIYMFLTAGLLMYPGPAGACTSFFLEHEQYPVHGANFDWTDGAGMVVINRKGVSKTAVTGPDHNDNPAVWISKYGSVSFNMFGCDWAWGGMNEAGLAASTMILDETQYPKPDPRPSVFLGQWLQYQLDNSASVDEVLSSNANLRIRSTEQRLKAHYFFSDRSGNCGVVEFLEGRFVAYTKATMPVKVLVNDRYDVSLSVWEKFKALAGDSRRFIGDLSYQRFVRTAMILDRWQPANDLTSVQEAFSILGTATYKRHRHTHTQWQIVFDSRNRSIHYRTKKDMRLKSIGFEKIHFSCQKPIMFRNIDAFFGKSGTEGFLPLTFEINREMCKRAFRFDPLKPESSNRRFERVSRYPETFICK